MKNKKFVGIGIFLILLIAFIGFSMVSNKDSQSYSLFGDSVWLPQYWVAKCIPRADTNAEIQITTHTDNPTFYTCDTNTAKKYIPMVNGVQCQFSFDKFEAITVYSCKGKVTDKSKINDPSVCTDIRSGFSSVVSRATAKSWTVNAGDTLYVDTDAIFGDATMFARYPSYGLEVRTADGFTGATTTNCEVNSIDTNKYHTIDKGSRTEVKPDFPLNVVSGLKQGLSTQAVTLSDIENGKPIYITRPGYYYLILTSEDGFRYVATDKGERSSERIECIPRTSGCTDEAKIVPLESQACDMYGGAITNYAPIIGDNSQLCKYTCESGKLSKSTDCIKVQTSCPADKPLWDTTTGNCIGLSDEKPVQEESSYTALWVLLIGSAVLSLVWALRR